MEKQVIGDATLYLGDCLEILPTLGQVDAVITDPPYFKVKGDYWDNQWDNPTCFLDWMRGVLSQLADRMKSNASAYVFASPQMAGRVEAIMYERLNVLGHIVWRKGKANRTTVGWHQKAEKEALRSFLFETERILFAEHYNSDNYALGESSYTEKCDELRGFVFESLRAYLDEERKRAGVDKISVNVACGFSPSAGGMASRHYFSRSQWWLPTPQHYEAMRKLFNANGGRYLRREYEDLRREYEDLRREYEDLRREYEDLRREYEDLRRPFNMTAGRQWGDVWEFDPVAPYPGKHPCEKPSALLVHMLESSTKPGALVLDAFMGRGSTGKACIEVGRSFIGIERDHEHFDIACERIENAQRQGTLFAPDGPAELDEPTQQGLGI